MVCNLSILRRLSTWQSENGSFPLSVKMAALNSRVENKSVAVYSAGGGGRESVYDLVVRLMTSESQDTKPG